MPELYSMQFLLFLAAVLICYYAAEKLFPRFQWVILLCASLFFYTWAGLPYVVFLLAVSAACYRASHIFAEPGVSAENKKRVMVGVLLLHFLILGLFKYTGLFRRWSGWVIPLGLSYYTFQSVSYLLDTYNGKQEAAGSFWKYLLFLSWFPQLLQGPINRFGAMAPQFFRSRKFDSRLFRKGLMRYGYGVLKKYAVANMLAATVSHIFTQVDGDISGCVVVFGILVYSFQQYTDFSGGIDMVMGVSELFGIEMSENFRQPYFAVSLADFWRRWHISLGAWMKDYVFYPLALSKPMRKWTQHLRKKFGMQWSRSLPAGAANIAVFFLVGLWHGADLHFLVWGLFNGLVIAVSDCMAPLYRKVNLPKKGVGIRLFRTLRTFIIVNIGWYFDAITDVRDSFICLRNTFTRFRASAFAGDILIYQIPYRRENYMIAAVALLIVFVVSLLQERGVDVREGLLKKPAVLRLCLYLFCALLVLMAFPFAAEAGGFMYANF